MTQAKQQIVERFRQSLQECAGVPVQLSKDQPGASSFWWEFRLGLDEPALWLGLSSETASSLHDLLKSGSSVDALQRIAGRFSGFDADEPKRVEQLPEDKTLQGFAIQIDEHNQAL